ncbi:MAG: hypothetical protein OSJ39_00605 [Clostridia bacterium]|nr:hypothetical protein [Clostridia bacterium]
MGILNFLTPKDDEYMTGYYYERRPKSPDDGRMKFRYSRLDPYSRVFDTALGQMRLDRETYSLKTRTSLPWKVKGYISAQNGKFFQIAEVLENDQPRGSEEVLRLFKSAPETEYTIRLVCVDNPWGIGI